LAIKRYFPQFPQTYILSQQYCSLHNYVDLSG